eukprot:jgi/Mesvir1/23079/Mv10003-RA.1
MEEIPSTLEGFGDEIHSIIRDVTQQIRAKFAEASEFSIVESFQAFAAAINWTEPWLQALLCAHVLLFVTVIATRRNSNAQSSLFFFLLIAIFMAEPLNTFLRKHWASFSTQDYFDRHGTFISLLWSLPLLVDVLICLYNLLAITVRLLVKTKRAELKRKARAAQAQEGGADGASAPGEGKRKTREGGRKPTSEGASSKED